MAEILGEENPGLFLWVSLHGFHHISLTRSPGWRIFWIVILAILTLTLVSLVIYYFVYVFTGATYSKFILESPDTLKWPATIICDKQLFSFSKVGLIATMTPSHASLMSWTVSPLLARSEVTNNTRYAQLTNDINTVLSRPEYNQHNYNQNGQIPGGPVEMLLRAMAPNCTQLILKCSLGKKIYNGRECCDQLFDPNPYFTQAGTCYTTRGAKVRPDVSAAGDGNGMTITTMHDPGNTFDVDFASPDIYGSSGINFAVVNDAITVQAAMATRAQSVQTGETAMVGLSRTVVNNEGLGWSLIGRTSCVMPGERDPYWVDADLNYGVDYRYGYTKASCELVSKEEMIARELLFCTFSPLMGDNVEWCSPNQSATYQKSFIALTPNGSATSGGSSLPTVSIDQKPGLRPRYDKPCPRNCIEDKYTPTVSMVPLSQVQITALQQQITASGQAIPGAIPLPVVLKLYLTSMEYSNIENYPMNGVQFIAELGGLMSFFLGISAISLMECCLYCCCGGFKQAGIINQDAQKKEEQYYVG